MRAIFVAIFVATFAAGCANASALESPCVAFDDPADWPMSGLYMGEIYIASTVGAQAIAHPSEGAHAELEAALIVAELHLANGAPEHILGTVYDTHAWLADGGDRRDGALLRDELGIYNAQHCR